MLRDVYREDNAIFVRHGHQILLVTLFFLISWEGDFLGSYYQAAHGLSILIVLLLKHGHKCTHHHHHHHDFYHFRHRGHFRSISVTIRKSL
jgi:hypothetical protein